MTDNADVQVEIKGREQAICIIYKLHGVLSNSLLANKLYFISKEFGILFWMERRPPDNIYSIVSDWTWSVRDLQQDHTYL